MFDVSTVASRKETELMFILGISSYGKRDANGTPASTLTWFVFTLPLFDLIPGERPDHSRHCRGIRETDTPRLDLESRTCSESEEVY